ncbi:restriction endonuclease subunit S [Priestia flexa]|uniref:Restriction endonuclease subunit S n=1 Tax=Priestia flexa TaxID=86664 RepID=A0ABU4J805_9BACI|nr:restriction endonuclease subunit S [Priestia flexa]MDW8517108.1 restriction endonuclease subunit S [Priestia flexa]
MEVVDKIVLSKDVYQKTEIGKIPRDWEVKKINEIADVNKENLSGNTPAEYEFYYYDLSSVDKGKVLHPTEKLKFADAPSRAKRLFKTNDVLMSTVRPNLQGFTYVDFDSTNSVCSTGFAVIAGKYESDSMYIYQNLFSYGITRQIQKLLVGSNYPAINSKDVENLKVPFPNDNKEREKIASILSTWDKAIELKEKLIEQKKEQKKGLMQKLLTGEVRLPGFKEEWEEVKLGKIATIIMGQSPTSDSYNDLQEGIPLIQGNADIKKRKTCPRIWTTKPTKKCLPGDIIVTVRAPVGSVALSHHEACIGRGVCAIRGSINQDYLYYLLIQKENWWSKISQGSTFESVNSNDIKELKVSMPPMMEQQAVSKVLKTFDQDLYLHEKELVEAKKQKQGLMQLLLTGKVRVKV